MRPAFEEIYLKLAVDLSRRSTCYRLQVGCVVTSEDFTRVLGIGYNGGAAGQVNGCDRDEPGNCGCLHAEDNALLKCSSNAYTPKVMFVTHLPCPYCAKRIVNKGGFKRVLYLNDYRKDEGKLIFQSAGISFEKWEFKDEQVGKAVSPQKSV